VPTVVKVPDLNLTRAKYIKIWIFAILVIPTLMDYVFMGSSVARYSRILLFIGVSTSLVINRDLMLKSQLIGTEILILIVALFAIGTISSLTRGGSITPNIALLLVFLLVVSANIDLIRPILNSLGFCLHILIFLSALVILLKLNPMNYFASADGYPVYLNNIGIPGRNYGIFSHPNVLGQISCLSLLFMIESKVKKIFLLLPSLCLIKCGSRTAIIGAFVGLLIYVVANFFRSRSNSNKRRKIDYPLVVGTALFAILLAMSTQFILYINLIDPNALTSRAKIWQNSLEIFKGSSLIGLGWDWENRAIDSQLLNIWAVSAHNVILEIIFATGVAGLLIFLFFIAKILAYFSNISLIEKMILTAIGVSGISESYLSLQYPTIQTYLFFAIAVGANRENKNLS
jgi:O-antigen ligase